MDLDDYEFEAVNRLEALISRNRRRAERFATRWQKCAEEVMKVCHSVGTQLNCSLGDPPDEDDESAPGMGFVHQVADALGLDMREVQLLRRFAHRYPNKADLRAQSRRVLWDGAKGLLSLLSRDELSEQSTC